MTLKLKLTGSSNKPKVPTGPTELVPPNDPSLPPGPPQMNRPVGPPPAPVEMPRTFEEMVEKARLPNVQLEKAMLWATLAQALATKQVADKLDALNEYLGVYDEGDPDDKEDGEDSMPPSLAGVIAEGILGAVDVVKDDLLSNELVQMAIAAAQRGAVTAEALAKSGEQPSEN